MVEEIYTSFQRLCLNVINLRFFIFSSARELGDVASFRSLFQIGFKIDH